MEDRSTTGPSEPHRSAAPNGWNIRTEAEKIGVSYELKVVEIGGGGEVEPSFLKIAPKYGKPHSREER